MGCDQQREPLEGHEKHGGILHEEQNGNWYRDPKALYRDFLHAFVPWRLPCLFGTGDFFSFGEMSQMVASGKGLHGRI
jgi:hypothetical protein